MDFFDLKNIAFTALGYPMSWVELIATLAGVAAVWLSAKEKIINWPIGLVNIICSFFLFFKTGFYSDAFLQIFFFITNIYGWYIWAGQDKATTQPLVSVSFLPRSQQVFGAVAVIVASLAFGSIVNQLHGWYPSIFPVEAAFPYADSFVMMMSIAGNILLMFKKIESWILWVLVDIIAPILYFQKGIYLITLEYVVFLALASFALWNWWGIYKKQNSHVTTT
ncbi:MAG: nicotinamide riboside transporter PnuC [Saprospiraceae bacterium]|nr:nicotinamide riboside transporter PnuC [Saprospiraceae bacterium]